MTEPLFIPKPGQVDYTHIRYAPVINVIVTHGGRVLLAQRSSDMRLYPSHWSGISGFLDDAKSIEEKVAEELREEMAIEEDVLVSVTRGQPLLQEAPQYHKTWLVVPVLAVVRTENFTLNWEAQKARWFALDELHEVELLPGFSEVIGQFAEMIQ
jgi:NADH pyrophosphatase NudC (nudix superfamily)